MKRIVHTMLMEVIELNRLRLEKNLTYERMADGIGITRPTLYRILRNPDARMHDRTMYRVRRYLNKMKLTEVA